ncbi:hypothetical protein ACFQ61_03695 [Streptomyces sp. NPDC056500]|uniref:hypothetical protein n=1 Tax=Streptomyces sp. NPDC056500 TaxID=3345840 RepID=UPI00368D7B52
MTTAPTPTTPPALRTPPTPAEAEGSRPGVATTASPATGPALVDAVIALHQTGVADHTDWQVEVAHPTPAGNLIPDGVLLRWRPPPCPS